jgi:hypothetical protein
MVPVLTSRHPWKQGLFLVVLGLCVVVLASTLPDAVAPWRGFRAFITGAGLPLAITLNAMAVLATRRFPTANWLLTGLALVFLACWVYVHAAGQ